MEKEICWLAGILEGEGCFYFEKRQENRHKKVYSFERPVIKLSMTDEDVIQKVSKMWNAKYRFSKRRKQHWKDVYIVCISDAKAVLWMEKVLPLMGNRRTKKIEEILQKYYSIPRRVKVNLSKEELLIAKQRIDDGESLRKVADDYGLKHASLSYRLKKEQLW